MDFESLYEILPKPVHLWTIDDIYIWLTFINLQSFYQQFRNIIDDIGNEKIDGSCLMSLNEHDIINDLKIQSPLIVRKLLIWIKQGLPGYDKFLTDVGVFEQKNLFFNISQNQGNHSRTSEVDVTQGGYTTSKYLDLIRSAKHSNPEVQQELILEQVGDNLGTGPFFDLTGRGGKIGRSAHNEVLVIDQYVLRVHSGIEYFNPSYFLVDYSLDQENSTNDSQTRHIRRGTWIKITTREVISHNEIVETGDSNLHFQIDPVRNFIKISVLDKYRFRVSDVNASMRFFEFNAAEKHTIQIGRRSTNDICFTNDNTMSALHAKVYFVKGKWMLEDRYSTNGTWKLLQQKLLIEDGLQFRVGDSSNYFKCNIKTIHRHLTKSKSHRSIELSELKSVRKAEIKDLKPSEICTHCKAKVRNILFFPCCHSLYCEECAVGIELCPSCLTKASEIIKYYPG